MSAGDLPEKDPWVRVYRFVNDRRVKLEMSWAEMERRGAPTANKLRAMRDGVPLEKDDKREALCRVLRWESGSIEDILAGGEARAMPLAERGSYEEVLDLVREVEGRLAVLEERVAGLLGPGGR